MSSIPGPAAAHSLPTPETRPHAHHTSTPNPLALARAWKHLILGALLASAAGAQAPPGGGDGSAQQRVAQCEVAARFLASGRPQPRQAWAHEVILNCNDQAPAALSAALRRLNTSTDTGALGALLRAASYVRDTSFFNAALDVAGQSGASPVARAVGFLVAATEMTDLDDFSLSTVLSATEPMYACMAGHNDHSLRTRAGTALPTDARARLRRVIAAVEGQPDAPLVVANGTHCADYIARRVK